MEAILKHAMDDWEEYFAHGKQIKWLGSTYEHIFKPDGTLNMFDPVLPSKFKRLFAAARKLLEEFTVHNHSFTRVSLPIIQTRILSKFQNASIFFSLDLAFVTSSFRPL